MSEGISAWSGLDGLFEKMKEHRMKNRTIPEPLPLVRLAIDHPHSYRTWELVEPDKVPGFWVLRSELPLGRGNWTSFELTLHESEFQRL